MLKEFCDQLATKMEIGYIQVLVYINNQCLEWRRVKMTDVCIGLFQSHSILPSTTSRLVDRVRDDIAKVVPIITYLLPRWSIEALNKTRTYEKWGVHSYFPTWHLCFIMLLCKHAECTFPTSCVHQWDWESDDNLGWSLVIW